MTPRRRGQKGQIDVQSRSHEAADCGSYELVRRIGVSRWVVRWTAACDEPGSEGEVQFVSRKHWARYF